MADAPAPLQHVSGIGPTEVEAVYRALLGRPPENQAVMQSHMRAHSELESLLRAITSSEEFRRLWRTDLDRMYDGCSPLDLDLLRKYMIDAEPEEGFVKDCLGSRMDARLTNFTVHLGGTVFNQLPIPNDYRAEGIEYVGTVKAVIAGAGPFVAVELGAGWGPWSVTAGDLARRLGRSPIKLYAVEANAGKVESLRKHYQDNDFDPAEHGIVNAVIGASDGYALFPIVDPIGNWGGEAVFVKDREKRDGYETVTSISLETLLKDEPLVDLVHFDIQGAERAVIQSALGLLTSKVRYLVIGTHSRSIEGALYDSLSARGWVLENEQPARCSHTEAGSTVLVDGTQVWRNPGLG